MTAESKSTGRQIIQEDEIDLLELVKVIWSKRRFILKVTFVFLVIGIVIAFASKVEYEASCKLLPESGESSNSGMGGLSNLAGLAGVNLDMGGSSGSLSPALYPEIVQSLPFQLSLLNQVIYFEKLDSFITSKNYFENLDKPSVLAKYTIGLPGTIVEALKGDDEKKPLQDSINGNHIIKISKEESRLIDNLKNRLSVESDEGTGIITVTVEMPDAYAAAEMTNLLVEDLTRRITEYKIEKATLNLEFITERYLESQSDYQRKQEAVARYLDRNMNLTSSLTQTENDRLQNEMNISFDVYKGLATQLEQAKIKVKEETPVFTVLEPIKIPIQKSKPKKAIILILFTFFGISIGVGVQLILVIQRRFAGGSIY